MSLVGYTIGNYKIIKYISSGSFGDVYQGNCVSTNKSVALKVPSNKKQSDKFLEYEIKVYNCLNTSKIIDCGISYAEKVIFDNKGILVMELLGDSLEKKLSTYKKLSLKHVIGIAIKSVEIIYYIHSKGILHKDLKPDNFAFDYSGKNLYCIDFGLSKQYVTSSGKHISFKKSNFKGTCRFASIAAHRNYEQSRKDDMECLGYMFIYLFEGKLPWQSINYKDKEKKYNAVLKQKESVKEDVLCKNMPKQFSVYLKYVKSLDFNEKPRYASIILMFKNLYKSIYNEEFNSKSFFLK